MLTHNIKYKPTYCSFINMFGYLSQNSAYNERNDTCSFRETELLSYFEEMRESSYRCSSFSMLNTFQALKLANVSQLFTIT